MEPVILPDERRDTLAVTVCLPGCPGKSWCRLRRLLDEDAEGKGITTDRDSRGHRIRCRVDHRHIVAVLIRDIDTAALWGC